MLAAPLMSIAGSQSSVKISTFLSLLPSKILNDFMPPTSRSSNLNTKQQW